jgi:hypothetical protein
MLKETAASSTYGTELNNTGTSLNFLSGLIFKFLCVQELLVITAKRSRRIA